MPRNDEGEFELVLGNRQLLSVFFILVVLLGVFFTMGYIVGRNNPSEQTEVAQATAPPMTSKEPMVVDPGPATKSASEPKPSPAAESKSEPPPPAPVETKAPVKEEPAPPKVAEKKPEPVKPAPKKEEPLPPAPKSGTPPAGTSWLQVVAIDRAGADILAETLRKKSFPAMVAPGPSPTLFRVLVGPYKDKNAMTKGKLDLEAVGFKGAIMRNY